MRSDSGQRSERSVEPAVALYHVPPAPDVLGVPPRAASERNMRPQAVPKGSVAPRPNLHEIRVPRLVHMLGGPRSSEGRQRQAAFAERSAGFRMVAGPCPASEGDRTEGRT